MSENLRRKGRGRTVRPTCPTCQQDLKRSYNKTWDGKKGKFIPSGWECVECKYKQWD